MEQFAAAGQAAESPRPEESIRAADDLPARRDEEPPGGQETESYRPAGAEARRPPRPPPLEDDDDFDDDFPRRRRRGLSREFALSRVSGPAGGLIAVAVIGLILAVLNMAAGGFNMANAPPGQEGLASLGIFEGIFKIVISMLVLNGAQKMKRLESYGFAKAMAIIAMIPVISPCCILGLVFGIQALNALNEPEVKAAFDIQQISAED
jgi:hypothetical protein